MNGEEAARVAADPATTGQELHDLAAENPEVSHLIAVHPNVYPELLEWIREQPPTAGNAAEPDLSGWQPPTTGSQQVIRVQAKPLPPTTRAKSAAVALLTVFALALVGFTAHAFLNFGPDYKTGGTAVAMSSDSQSKSKAPVVAAGKDDTAKETQEKKKSTKPKYPAPKKAVTVEYMVDPNGNVACTVRSGVLYCSVYEEYFTDSGYESCDSWPATLRLGKSGAALACDKAPVGGWGRDANLPYGTSAKSGKFACISYEAGMSCWNTTTGKSLVLSWRGWEGGTKGKVKEADFPW